MAHRPTKRRFLLFFNLLPYFLTTFFFSFTHYRTRTDNPVGADFESAVFTYFTKRALFLQEEEKGSTLKAQPMLYK